MNCFQFSSLQVKVSRHCWNKSNLLYHVFSEHSPVVNSMDSEFWLFYLLALWPKVSMRPLYVSVFLIYKAEILMAHTY